MFVCISEIEKNRERKHVDVFFWNFPFANNYLSLICILVLFSIPLNHYAPKSFFAFLVLNGHFAWNSTKMKKILQILLMCWPNNYSFQAKAFNFHSESSTIYTLVTIDHTQFITDVLSKFISECIKTSVLRWNQININFFWWIGNEGT